MRRSATAKLALMLFALFCIAAAIDIGVTLYTTRLYIEEVNQRLNRSLAQTIAHQKPVVRDGQIDRVMLNNVFDALMAVNPSIEIYLLDDAGNIRAFDAPPGRVKRSSVALDPIRRFLAGERLPIRGDDPRDPSRRKIFSAARVGNGYLYVILAGEEFESTAGHLRRSWILQQGSAMAIVALLVTFAAALLLFAQVMQVETLKEVDLQRRQLVANVSHDLRTPLASLQGYIDTLLLKEGQLSREEQRHFLEIAARHSQRLAKLVDELFELAKLDAQAAPLRREPFALGELVQDVVQKFQLRAESAGVRLIANFPRDLPLVSGDLALIERVLENLIDNALRYTPSGGSVTVALVPDGGKVTLRVSDTGSGIAEEQLPRIFDRFWRGDDASRGGAGLGLAIAKRIVELHGGSLAVASRLGEGTTFSFAIQLPRRDGNVITRS